MVGLVFKYNQKVICKNADLSILDQGKTYTVDKLKHFGFDEYGVTLKEFPNTLFYADRFEPIEQ